MSERPLRVFLVAGEHSGDSHGAALAKRLRQRDPSIVVEGLGGPLMAEAGVSLAFDFVEHAAMGLLPVLKKLPFFTKTLQDTAARLASDPPDLLVPIDYPGFNLRLSQRAKRAGIPVCYYVSPQVWAWRPGRIHRIARAVDHMMVLFPFERALYEGVGVPCTFVGHPLFDELRTRRPSPAFRDGLGLDPATPVLGLLPGSRQHEVDHNLPLILRAAAKVKERYPEVAFALPLAKESLRPAVEAALAAHPGLEVPVLPGKASDVARVARAAITVSGTATLELLHYDCPMVIVYQLTAAKVWLKNRLLTTPWVALVNVLAQREVCPEYVVAGDVSDQVAEDALALLRPGRRRKRSLSALKRLREEVDVKGSHGVAADTVLRLAQEARARRA
ncbi:MAG: lipid-A-disaccharide synthase [Planctomycetota bacterium]